MFHKLIGTILVALGVFGYILAAGPSNILLAPGYSWFEWVRGVFFFAGTASAFVGAWAISYGFNGPIITWRPTLKKLFPNNFFPEQ